MSFLSGMFCSMIFEFSHPPHLPFWLIFQGDLDPISSPVSAARTELIASLNLPFSSIILESDLSQPMPHFVSCGFSTNLSADASPGFSRSFLFTCGKFS